MKIGILHWGYPPIIGGVETHLSLMGPQLVRLGHEVAILTGVHSDTPNSYMDNGVHIKRIPIMDLNWLFRRGFVNLAGEIRREIGKFLDEYHVEIIHAHNMHYFSELHAHILEQEAEKRMIPIVLTAHNVWDDAECVSLTRDIHWDEVIAVSNYIKTELEGYGLDMKRITTIHHGIEGKPFFEGNAEEAKKRYPQLEGKKVIFHAARISLAKGCAVSVKAFRLVKEEIPEAMLVMAGTRNVIDWGAYQQREIAYIKQLLDMFNLDDYTLIDHYDLQFIPHMFAAADVVLYPSIFAEPFGIVMLEGMAAAKPVIISRSGGMPEIIKNRVNGFVVEPRDHRALAKTIIRLLRHPDLAREIGAKGRETFKQKYYLERMVDQTVAVYRRALERRISTRPLPRSMIAGG
jgi:glycosyltransferase involved in cell wall biosynthesis